ncbi:SLC13 family permease [Serratia aquatilis]|uniref:SLC13 family permease n=1 Tax=Serratia aquatilis TaxID=1737515 RepID=A0ABV6EKR2_9GAMM
MMGYPMGVSALITLIVIALWATSRLPEYLVALLFFAAVMVLQLAPASVVFSGFASSAFWLVLSGFVLGTAIRSTGLADRLANRILPLLAGSWPRLVGGVVAISYALAFVMPSNMGRITLLMPIIMVLAGRAGLAEGTRGRYGLALAVGLGTFQLSASILPANVPNLVMSGAAESTFGIHFTYLAYLILHAPILGLAKGVLLTLCICWLFPAKPQAVEKIPENSVLTAAEWRLILLLVATVLLWITDSWHGIPAAWVGLSAACLCLLPRIGFLTGEQFAAGVNIRTCIYVAGILGLTALVSHSGLGDWLGNALLDAIPQTQGRPFVAFSSMIGLTTLLNFVVTANGVPALFTPLAQVLAEGSGLPLATVLMTQVIGYATPLLPYQASPIVVAMGMGKVPPREGLKLCLLVAVLTFGLLVPLDYLWFRLLGSFG